MKWDAELLTLTISANVIVACSYFVLPWVMVRIARKQKIEYGALSDQRLALVSLFALFIFFCGTGHLLDVLTLYTPLYWLKGWWDLVTGLISALTCVVLWLSFREN